MDNASKYPEINEKLDDVKEILRRSQKRYIYVSARTHTMAFVIKVKDLQAIAELIKEIIDFYEKEIDRKD